MFSRAQTAFAEYYSLSPQSLNLRSSSQQSEPDELAVLGGHKFVMRSRLLQSSVPFIRRADGRCSDSRSSDKLPSTNVSLEERESSAPQDERYPDPNSFIVSSYAMHSRADMTPFTGDQIRYGELPPRPLLKISPSPERDFLQSGIYIPTPVQRQGQTHPDQMDVTLAIPEGQNQNELWNSFLSGLLPSSSNPDTPSHAPPGRRF